jgi:hypothetical protein
MTALLTASASSVALAPLVASLKRVENRFTRSLALVPDKRRIARSSTRELEENASSLLNALASEGCSESLRTTWRRRALLILEELAHRARAAAALFTLSAVVTRAVRFGSARELTELAEICPPRCSLLTASLVIAPGAPALSVPALSRL